MGRNLLKTNKDYAINNNGGYSGNFKDDEERKKALEGLSIADDVIKSDYFKNK
jgi:hypothetical protein